MAQVFVNWRIPLVMADLTYAKYFLYMLIGFFLGRITMAIQYAVFKELARSKSKKENLETKQS